MEKQRKRAHKTSSPIRLIFLYKKNTEPNKKCMKNKNKVRFLLHIFYKFYFISSLFTENMYIYVSYFLRMYELELIEYVFGVYIFA